MIETAAIVWAVLATGGAVAVYVLMRGQVRYWRDMLNRYRGEAVQATLVWRRRYYEVEDRLRQIEQQRHNAAVKARAAQLAQQRAAILAEAHEVAPQVERRAA